MTLYALDGLRPEIAEDTWIAPDANLIGRIVVETGGSVWFGCTLRGDNEEIRLGRGSNLQDLCVCHTDPGHPLVVGPNCTIGHRAILHGCTIGAGALVGVDPKLNFDLTPIKKRAATPAARRSTSCPRSRLSGTMLLIRFFNPGMAQRPITA